MKIWIGNFKGPKGDTGAKGDKGNKGDRGEPGLRGSRWTSGTGITGTSTVGTKFPSSGITDAQSYDYYVNTDTGNLYECKVAGTADVAEWAYIGSFKGPKGDAGPAGSISDINSQKPTYSEAAELKNIESGETVQESFGKIKKAVSVLISHYAQKATQSILGHVKLSDSSAITISGEYALDAIEKNASVAGTLANMISQANSNLFENGAINDPNSVQVNFAILNGWDRTNSVNYPPNFINVQGILITIWNYRVNNSLESYRKQVLLWNNNIAFREYTYDSYFYWTNWTTIDASKMEIDISKRSFSLVNDINYQSSLTRTYQLEFNKAYLLTAFPYSNDDAIDNGYNSGAYLIYTAHAQGKESVVKKLYEETGMDVSVDTNCMLSITTNYQYMHYSITRL